MMEVVDACTLPSVSCADDFCGLQTQIDFAAVAGHNYGIRVTGFGGASGYFNLTLIETPVLVTNCTSTVCNTTSTCTSCPAACCPGDICTNALDIGAGGVFNGSTVGAQFTDVGGCIIGSNSPDTWFKYTATTVRTITADTCGSLFDTILGARSGSCTGPSVGCNDDTADFSHKSSGIPFQEPHTTSKSVDSLAPLDGSHFE